MNISIPFNSFLTFSMIELVDVFFISSKSFDVCANFSFESEISVSHFLKLYNVIF
jgi:hypothetical protein